MAVERKYRGVEQRDELRPGQARPDTRSLTQRGRTFFATTDGVIAAMMVLPFIALLLVRVPLSGEMLLLAAWLFYQMFVNPGHNDPKRKTAGGHIKGKHRVYDFPFRVPASAKRFDGSYAQPRLGNGITFLGREISSKLEIWSSDSDLRTHMLVLGTTGSGKTEFLLGLVFNALIQNSGFIYTDGKGAVDLYNNVFRLARYLGREDDLLVINFLTSGRDFLDKQMDRTTNTMNPFALGSSGMLIELIISLMDDSGGGGDMWKGRAIAFVAGLTRVLCYLRDRGYILLDSNKFTEFFELPVVERVVFEKKITVGDKEVTIDDPLFDKVIAPLRNFVLTLPGYTREKMYAQEQKTLEQHGFITMQLTRLFGDLSFTYGYIFQTLLGEVDMYDVVINRRILVVLLPSLERAPDSLKMLGKLIVGSIKQMMAGCLGNRLEGSVREIVDSRPTNAAVPFYVVLDEYGYYAVLGFAVAPAQARSLGFPQPLRAKIRTGPHSWTTMGEIMPGDTVMLPNGEYAPVREIRVTGDLPVARLTMQSGRQVESAYAHHWPVRIGSQHMIKTVLEIERCVLAGLGVELAVATEEGLVFEKISQIDFVAVEPTRCIVVEHDLHCYVTDDDLVTHNCITFAAQDFSSLQKASKEEADATWENTNVRIIGRITSGSESETWRRVAGVASDAQVYEGGRKEHLATSMMGGYRTNQDATVREAKRVTYDDLAQQENGEFTFLIGKKNSDGSGGVRVIRARTFYTAVDEKPSRIRINHFLKVEPPRNISDGDQEIETIEFLEKVIAESLKSGDLAKVFPNEPTEMLKAPAIFKMSQYLREAQAAARLPLDQALRVAFLCEEREATVMADAKAKAAAVATSETDLALAQSVIAAGEPVAASVPAESPHADSSPATDDDLPTEVPTVPAEPAPVAVSAVDDFIATLSLEDGISDTDRGESTPERAAARADDEFATDFVLDDLAPAVAAPAATASAAGDTVADDGAFGEVVLDVPEGVSSVGDVAAADGDTKGKSGRDTGDRSGDGGTAEGGSAAASGETSSSGSGSGGGMGMSLVPTKPAMTEPVARAASSDAVREAVIDYLDSYEFDTPPLGEGTSTAAAGDGQAPKQVISVLTLRTLGEDEEPSEIGSYLAEQIAMTEAALGVKKDSLEIQAEAKRTADHIERITSYAEGPTPVAPTLQEWDATVEGLLDAVDRNPPNYL
ncbi:FtsK/SpoIIIE domain-containing protein [Burkholderia anthina]|uniref:FtsK/SpoIIIE domain-containing protein n=1 Tax=Burkholderia anthina TaxID=179879 RepID=UPI00272B95C3